MTSTTDVAPGSELSEMFRPPVNRAMRVLDRSFFKRTVPVTAAAIYKNTDISTVRKRLDKSRDTLEIPRLKRMYEVKVDDVVRRSLLLREGIKHDDNATWSPTVSELVNRGVVSLQPYELTLDYNSWNYADIIEAILPEDSLEEIPAGFAHVGHVAHLNLREPFLPYRHLIAQIILDKNPNVRTVIRKTEDVGSKSEFRTFPYEVIAGDHDMNVIQHEQDCEFRFDFSRVYWNTRLEPEHRRLVKMFKQGDMVCDVMAGVGPFAVPAGKKKIFVWANDLNPHGYEAMQDAVKRNKVDEFVIPFNQDGREFIPWSAKTLIEEGPKKITVWKGYKNRKDKWGARIKERYEPELYDRPVVFDHYVLNLPDSAISFLDAFIGVYAGHEELFAPYTEKPLPMVHVYCFSGNSKNPIDDEIDICKRISEKLEYTITTEDRVGGSGNTALELSIHDARLVSPKKRYFCASFRLPREVAFRQK
ncbi:tRNA (guanine) methyltransferase [Aspergillus undulatus]|uniref:tRNA (guanine) methyltransferase n=1 Tax=Aspergillus undulatus TaxID=1810928 RepID=UPI003CCE1883